MDPWLQLALTSVASVAASSGLWAWIQKKDSAKNATSRLLLGLAYDKIISLGMTYIERGWISRDEFEDFQNYLYQPYKDAGGNGVAERIMYDVSHLPLRSPDRYSIRSPQEGS